MNRREMFLKVLSHATLVAGSGFCYSCASGKRHKDSSAPGGHTEESSAPLKPEKKQTHEMPSNASEPVHLHKNSEPSIHSQANNGHHALKSQRQLTPEEKIKLRDFDKSHPGDLFVPVHKRKILSSCFKKLSLVKKYVGYGHFNLLSFDQMLIYSKLAAAPDGFTPSELEFLEEVFYFDAEKYGFYGKKLNHSLTETISDRNIIKIAGSGHYLYKDSSLPIYNKIIKDVGQTLILTSGIRSVVKQMHLFLGKTLSVNGNFSQASRSLAPPGHSYHAVGDFDVGKKGLGSFNFTNKFSETDEYKKLTDLGYIDIRYPTDNPFGVRFEPWHIEGTGHT